MPRPPVAPQSYAEYVPDIDLQGWKLEVLPTPEQWTHGRHGAWIVFQRPDDLPSPSMPDTEPVYHGAPLSVAYAILRQGFVAGTSTHSAPQGHHPRSLTGVFGIGRGSNVGEQVHLAQDRAKISACKEWRFQADLPPGAWSAPVVLAVGMPREEVVELVPLGADAWKVVIVRSPGHVLHHAGRPLQLFVNPVLFNTYKSIPRLLKGTYIMCGGSELNPTSWACRRGGTFASCGRWVRTVEVANRFDWSCTTEARRWLCPECLAHMQELLTFGHSLDPAIAP